MASQGMEHRGSTQMEATEEEHVGGPIQINKLEVNLVASSLQPRLIQILAIWYCSNRHQEIH